MAHFAEINPENNKVIRVLVVADEFNEEDGNLYLSETCGFGGIWVKTSYNTHAGEHTLGGTPFRKNYAGIGFLYDATRDAFLPPKPHLDFLLNEDTCTWYTTNPALYYGDVMVTPVEEA